MFFSFDGIDGVGKSTQIQLFLDWLRGQGLSVTTCRDPGSTPLGEKIREILLAHDDQIAIDRRAEMLLYMAARAQLVEQVIRPALARGEIVVSDRFLLANVVYQSYAGGLDLAQVKQVGEVAIAGVCPDVVFLLDMPVEEADKRLGRELDRMESQGREFRERLREGFLTEARLAPDAIHVVEAAGPIDEIQAEIRRVATAALRVE